ncbi:MAG: radical SAM protein [Treponema sp.]|nr:radical SAM protein [Treponema sp.]
MQKIIKFLLSILWFIRRAIPDSIFHSKILIPIRIFYGNTLMNRKRKLLVFDVHIAEQCNLSCSGCLHFSSLASNAFIDIEKYESDCKRISELSGGEIDEIHILGGEPLLNPRIIDIMKMSRSYFPHGTIMIITNGILLKNQPDEFWDCCRTNNILIRISVYPINLDYTFIIDKAKAYRVQLEFTGKIISNGGKIVAAGNLRWLKLPIDINGMQNPRTSNALCGFSNSCFQLVEGKLYKCCRIAYIKYFNKYFNVNLEVTEDDYIDIYKAKDMDEILDRLRKPAPFCRYCKLDTIYNAVEWVRSKKEISEWIVCEDDKPC